MWSYFINKADKVEQVDVAGTEMWIFCCAARVTDFVPMWRVIQRDITRKISAGLLKPGDKLPSTREMAEEYDVAPNTVRRAVDALMVLGVLRGHQGRGVYVSEATD